MEFKKTWSKGKGKNGIREFVWNWGIREFVWNWGIREFVWNLRNKRVRVEFKK